MTPDSPHPAPATPEPQPHELSHEQTQDDAQVLEAPHETPPEAISAASAAASPEATAEIPEPPDAQLDPQVLARQAREWAALDAAEWVKGENRSTRIGRALFAIVAGGYLLWAQNAATIPTHFEWGRWIALAVLVNGIIPLVIANLFFAQGVQRFGLRDYWLLRRHGVPLTSFHDYLPDQSLISWHLGWKWRPLKRLLLQGVAMGVLMLPVLWFASRDQAARSFYQSYLPAVPDARSWAWLIGTLIVYMVCWEWFFRGFLLFTLAQGFGAPAAIVIQAVMFGFAHSGKPPMEVASSFAGGLILGIVCWREKSFVPAFVAHALIHISWAILVLKF